MDDDRAFPQAKPIDFNSSLERFNSTRSAPKTGRPAHERADLVEQLVKGINGPDTGKWRPVTHRQITGQTRHLSTSQLYTLLRKCQGARRFGALFWSEVKKNHAAKAK